jgi:hypothetical protein
LATSPSSKCCRSRICSIILSFSSDKKEDAADLTDDEEEAKTFQSSKAALFDKEKLDQHYKGNIMKFRDGSSSISRKRIIPHSSAFFAQSTTLTAETC